ncbi:MAG: hypothetical protein ACO1SV_16995 [Fimbriimonas sp.]
MPRVPRVSDIIEITAEKAMYYAIGGIVGVGLAAFIFAYRGSSGMFVPLAGILGLIGVASLGTGSYIALQIRKVTSVPLTCPICNTVNELTEMPSDDFPCVECHRMVPVKDGLILSVSQVRCGFCNELNYYSDKTGALLCENCNHEIPISNDDDAPRKVIPAAYAVVDDESLYELVLTGHGNKEEELIASLQHILALNRNQVKQMLTEMPVTLLTGITRRKAEMLKAQIGIHDGQTEFRPMEEARF